MFNTPTQLSVSIDERNQRSVLELVAGDRPGLLCDIGKVLVEERIELLAAKVMTVGERAEDVFYVTDRENRPLDAATAERLVSRLTEALDRAPRPARARARRRLRRPLPPRPMNRPRPAAALPVRAAGAPEAPA